MTTPERGRHFGVAIRCVRDVVLGITLVVVMFMFLMAGFRYSDGTPFGVAILAWLRFSLFVGTAGIGVAIGILLASLRRSGIPPYRRR